MSVKFEIFSLASHILTRSHGPKFLGLGSIFQNFGIGIGLGITNSGQNPKKSQEIPKVVIEILNNLISMNYLLFFPVKIFDCKPVFQRSQRDFIFTNDFLNFERGFLIF